MLSKCCGACIVLLFLWEVLCRECFFFFFVFFFLMIRRPPRSTQSRSSAASDVYKRQGEGADRGEGRRVRRPGALQLGHGRSVGGVGVRGAQTRDLQAADPWGQRVRLHLSLIHISEPTRPY